MNSKSPQICRLCLLTTDEAVNIWEIFEDTSIALILAKHFWFKVHKNDGLTEWLCQMCWIQTKTFHEFYKKVEQYHKSLWDSEDKCSAELDENASVDKNDADLESDLNIVKCEETELTFHTFDSQISKEYTSDYNDDNYCNKSETEDVSHKTSTKMLKIGDDTDQSRSLAEKEKLKAQIREVFTMKCEICSDVAYESLQGARKHYRRVHKIKNGYLMCCDKKFWVRSQVLNHIRYHQSNTDARCKIEEENAQIRKVFNMTCEFCSDVEFDSFVEAKEHYREVHHTNGYLMCCGKKFWRRFEILYHIPSHDPDVFRCGQCGKSFRNKVGLQLHIENHAPLHLRAHKCNLCSSSFGRESLLRLHVKTKHLSKTGEEFPCDKCDKHFRSKLLLAGHIRNVHEYSLDHVCETCACQFKTKHMLANHMLHHHSTIPKVQCDICGAWLKHKEILKKHLKYMHLDSNSEALKCTICKKLVKSKRALSCHMAYVHSERRHQCVLCDKAFKTATILKEHTAIHTGEDLYNCPYCDKKFKSSANMYSHRKKTHLAEWTRDSTKRDELKNNS